MGKNIYLYTSVVRDVGQIALAQPRPASFFVVGSSFPRPVLFAHDLAFRVCLSVAHLSPRWQSELHCEYIFLKGRIPPA